MHVKQLNHLKQAWCRLLTQGTEAHEEHDDESRQQGGGCLSGASMSSMTEVP